MLAVAPSATDEPEQRTQSLRLVWRKPEIAEKRRPTPRRAPIFSVAEFDEIAYATRALARDRRALNRRRALARTAVMKDEAVSRTGVIVFDYLQGAANFAEHGYAFPSVKRIAEKTGKSERAVRNCLEPLEFGRYVAIKLRWVRGVQAPSWYAFPCLTIDWSSQADSECTSECTPERTDGARQGAADVHPDIRNYPPPKIPFHTHSAGVGSLFSQLKEKVPSCERFIEQFLRHLLAGLEFKANDPLLALAGLAKQFSDLPDLVLQAALEKLWSAQTHCVTAGQIRQAFGASTGTPVEASSTAGAGKISYSKAKHPQQYAVWIDYCRQPDALPEYRRCLRLFEAHGFVLVDRAMPPGHEAANAT